MLGYSAARARAVGLPIQAVVYATGENGRIRKRDRTRPASVPIDQRLVFSLRIFALSQPGIERVQACTR